MFLLDTSFIIELLRRPGKIKNYIPQIDGEGGTSTAISYYEIFRRGSRMNKHEKGSLHPFLQKLRSAIF